MAKYSDALDAVATALAQPTRRQILTRLGASTASSSELSRLTGVGLPTIAKHVEVLAAAGLITSQKSGRVVTHALCPAGFTALQDWISARTSFWTNQLDALHEHLEDR